MPSAGSPSSSPSTPEGRRAKRRAPRWTIAFLRALERCGEVRQAAEDAAVDHSTAYARRRAHADFEADWDAAVERFRRRVDEEANGPISLPAVVPDPVQHSATLKCPPLRGDPREEIVASGRIAKVGVGRWGKAREALFLAELVASANVRRAANAAGVSTQAVYARRGKDKKLARAWDLAVETGKARLSAMLVAAANASLDPDDLPGPELSPLPPVSIREAIAIARLPTPRETAANDGSWFGDDAEVGEEEYREATERIIEKLGRLNERERGERCAAGWAFDEGYDTYVPPGWARPDMIAIGMAGPRATADHHCPHCGGGLSLSAASVEHQPNARLQSPPP